MKTEAPVTDKRAAYLQDADDLERQADELEALGLARDALHLRAEAEQVRGEAPPRYTVEFDFGIWKLLEDGDVLSGFRDEAKARAVAQACNVHGSADEANLRRLYVEGLERQLSEIREALDARGLES